MFLRTLIAIFFIPVLLSAQKPSVQWNNIFGGQGFESTGSIQATREDNIIVVGSSSSIHPDGWHKFWLFKLDGNGEMLWSKIYGDSGEVLRGRDVVETSDGGFILTGSFIPSDGGNSFPYVIKTDNTGEVMWETTIGDSTNSGGAYGVIETRDGSYILSGAVFTDSNGVDMLLSKLDQSGNEIWSYTYGDRGWDFPYSIAETEDGGIVLAGGVNPIGTEPLHLTLLKTDSNGNFLWQKNHWEGIWGAIAYDVKETSDSGFIVASWKREIGDDWGDGWLLKTDSFGDTLWTRQMTFAVGLQDRVLSVIQTPDGGYIATGGHSPNQQGIPEIFLIKTDLDGNIEWQDSYKGHEGLAVDQTMNGNILIAGDEWVDNDVNWQISVIKTDALELNFFIEKNIIDFGFVEINSTVTEVIKFYNVGSTDITIDSIRGMNPLFETEISTDTITAGDSALISISFTPVEFFTFSDFIKIFTNLGSVVITVKGTTGSGSLNLITDLISFGSIKIDSTVFRTAHIFNPSDQDLFVYSTHLTNPMFETNVPDSHLLPNDTTGIPVWFTPLDTSVFLDTLTIGTSGGIGKILLFGNASTAEITVSTNSIDFGSTDLGTSKLRTLIIFNTGEQPLNIKNFLLISLNFSVDADNQLLFPGDSLSVGITFSPADTGSFEELLRVLGEKESAEITLLGSSISVGVKT